VSHSQHFSYKNPNHIFLQFHSLTQSTLNSNHPNKKNPFLSLNFSLHHHGYYNNRARVLITCLARAPLHPHPHHHLRRGGGGGGGGAFRRQRERAHRRGVAVNSGVRRRWAENVGEGVGPEGEVGPGMEQSVPASVRRGVVRRPSVLLRALR